MHKYHFFVDFFFFFFNVRFILVLRLGVFVWGFFLYLFPHPPKKNTRSFWKFSFSSGPLKSRKMSTTSAS